jgi:hypothetical protein
MHARVSKIRAMSEAHLGAAVDDGYSDMERRRHGGSVSERERRSETTPRGTSISMGGWATGTTGWRRAIQVAEARRMTKMLVLRWKGGRR